MIRPNDIIALFYLLLIPATWLHGMLVFNFELHLLQSMYLQFMFFAFSLIVALSGQIHKNAAYAIFMIAIAHALSSFFATITAENTSFTSSGAAENLSFFLRSAFITFLSFEASRRLIYKKDNFFLVLLRFVYLFVTGSVAVHFFFDIGGVVNNWGNLRDYYTSYFTSGNSIIFSYVIAHFMISNYGLWERPSIWDRYILLITTITVLALMNSTSAPVIVLFLHFLHFLQPLGNRRVVTNSIKMLFLIGVAFLAAVSLVQNFGKVLKWAIDIYSYAWIRDTSLLEWRISNLDAVSILTSARDLKYLELAGAAHLDSLIPVLFGHTFALQKAFVFVESDPFDLFFALGAFGVFVYVAIFIAVGRTLYMSQHRHVDTSLVYFCKNAYFYTVLQSLATGHVLTEPISGFILGIVCSMIYVMKSKITL